MTTERIKRIQAGLESPTRDYLTYVAHQEEKGQPAPSFEEYIENEQLRQKDAEDAREKREAVEDKNFSDRQRLLEPVDYDVYAKQQEAKGLPSPSFEDYIHTEGQKAEQRSEGFGAIPRDYETYAKQREADGDPAPTFEEFIELEELRRISAREAREIADVNARQKEYYTSQEYEEGQIDARQQSIERHSRLNPAELQLEEFASQHAELEHQRMIDGGTEPSFEELRAKKAGQGILLGDEDYQHELENYRRENGLDLADEAQQKAEAQRNAKATEIINQRAIVKKNWDDVESEIASAEMVKGLYSLTYLDVRGAFYKVQLLDQSGKARGVYAIEEMRDTRDDEMGQLEAPILIYGVETTQNDIVSLLSCLNNTKVIYTFGQSFGNVVVNGEILLGPLGNMTVGERGGVRRLLDFFWTYRVSVYDRPITVSINGEAFYMYLTGLRLGKVDPDQHTLMFVLIGTLLDLSREEVKNGATNVNPSSSVNSDAGLERGLTISDRLRPETSQAGPPASETAAKVDSRLQFEYDVYGNRKAPEDFVSRNEFVSDTAVPFTEEQKQKAQQAKDDRRDLTAAQKERSAIESSESSGRIYLDDVASFYGVEGAGKIDLELSPAERREVIEAQADRKKFLQTSVAKDLSGNKKITGAAAFEDTVGNRQQAARNRAGFSVYEKYRRDTGSNDAEADAYLQSSAGQAEAANLARAGNEDLFATSPPVGARMGSIKADERSKDEMELELMKQRADEYSKKKTFPGDVVELWTVKKTVYDDPANRGLITEKLERLAQRARMPNATPRDIAVSKRMNREFGAVWPGLNP